MSKSIIFKNNNFLDSSSVSHNKEPLNEILESYLKKTSITMYCGNSVSYSINNYSQTKIPFTQYIRNGNNDKLIPDTTNHRVIIGQGVKKILVSCQVSVNRGTTSYITCWLQKNNSNIAVAGTLFTDWNPASAVITPKLIDVMEGDIIDASFSAGISGSGTYTGYNPNISTFITVEVLE